MIAALICIYVFQAVALLTQGVLAGLALAGAGAPVLGAHTAVGTVSLLLAVVQVGTALLLWRQRRGPLWLVAANVLFLGADGVQAVVGSAHLLALHLPIGIALFGAAAGLSIWSRELPRNGVRPQRGMGAVVSG